jgi:hypothetical protein
MVLADNYTVIPNTEISFVGWLSKKSALKRAPSRVVEFTDPEMANAIIYAGMVWDSHIHQCKLYDRACRVKQCFRWYSYGHISTQCNGSQICGYYIEQHETKHCKQKGVEGFTLRCAVCKGAHTAWSNACPAGKKKIGRVEQAKQIRSIDWYVSSKENTTRPRTHSIRNITTIQQIRLPATLNQTQTPTRNQDKATEPTIPEPRTSVHKANQALHVETAAIEVQPSSPKTRSTDQVIVQTSQEDQTPFEAIAARTSIIPSVEEDCATPAMQREHSQYSDPLTDPQF